MAVAQAVHNIDPLAPRGNPLALQVNEVRRVSSAGYSTWDSFNGRRYSRIGERPTAAGTLADIRRKSTVAFVRPGMSEKEDDYTILRLAKHDDIELMPTWKRYLYRFNAPLIILTIVAYWIYLVLRILYTQRAEWITGETYWMAWTFVTIEVVVV
jgi:hypothetical protein